MIERVPSAEPQHPLPPVYPERHMPLHKPGEHQSVLLDGTTAIAGVDVSDIYDVEDKELPVFVAARGRFGADTDGKPLDFAVVNVGGSWNLHSLVTTKHGLRLGAGSKISEQGLTLGRAADRQAESAGLHARVALFEDGSAPVPAKDLWLGRAYGAEVSSKHLTFKPAGTGVAITDRGSTNGTELWLADTEQPPVPEQTVVKTAGGAAVEGFASWDTPNKVDLYESGVYPSNEIDRAKAVSKIVRVAETEVALDDVLGMNLLSVVRDVELGQISKRSAMVIGALAAAGLPEGAKSGATAEALLQTGALTGAQLQPLVILLGNLRRAKTQGSTEAELIAAVDTILDGDFDHKGRLVRRGIFSEDGTPQTGLENYTAALLAITAGLDKSGRGSRILRLSNYMSTGKRGPDVMRLEEA